MGLSAGGGCATDASFGCAILGAMPGAAKNWLDGCVAPVIGATAGAGAAGAAAGGPIKLGAGNPGAAAGGDTMAGAATPGVHDEHAGAGATATAGAWHAVWHVVGNVTCRQTRW
jgi:hypothetical protein